jgi:hypothetical protein
VAVWASKQKPKTYSKTGWQKIFAHMVLYRYYIDTIP